MDHTERWTANQACRVLACRFLLSIILLTPVLSYAQSPEANKEIVRRMVEAINERDFAALDEVVAPDIVRHSAATPGVEVHSLDEFKAFLRQDLAAVPDAQQEIHLMLAEGDMVSVRALYRGTQTGPMGPFPPSGNPLELPFMGILRVEDGKIAEIWVEWDNVAALTQLGHFPPADESVAKEAERAELMATDRAWAAAAKAGDVERVLTYWTDDVVAYLEGRPVVRGLDAMEAVVRENRAQPGYSMSREVKGGAVAASGDFGYTTGTYEMTAPGPRGPVIRAGHYVCVWEKQADGSWKCEVQASTPSSDSSAAN